VLLGQQVMVHVDRFGPDYPFTIDSSVVQKLRQFGFVHMLTIQINPTSTDEVVRSVQKAIYWFSEGVRSIVRASKFVYYMFCVEVLLADKGDSLSYKLATRLASLIGKEKQDRLIVYSRFKKLYNLRNSIVHEGFDDIPEEDVNDIRLYAFLAIHEAARFCVQKGTNSKAQLYNEILERQFSFETGSET
jgi:hypothetical protein